MLQKLNVSKVNEIDGCPIEMDNSLCFKVSEGKLFTHIIGVVEDNEYRLLQRPSSSALFDSIAYNAVVPMFEEWATKHYQSN